MLKLMVLVNLMLKLMVLGRFDSFGDAVEARKRANKKYGFHENHGRQAA